MTKIKINRLPEGFEIRAGKIVKSEMKTGGPTGGHLTGDQVGYGLVTVPKSAKDTFYNHDKSAEVKFSLSAVPREMATIEAEGGETVLTDLDNDGKFGLYNINGPRHSAGGVPMNLPPQSFVFSDTKDMKFKPLELSDFGIKSRKAMTPAKISNKFDLNTYYGALKDEFADSIQVKSAELMLDKNTMGLSKLAFGQEAKKKFEGGVPLAAHPYIESMGQDPIEFSEKINELVGAKKEMPMAKHGAEIPYGSPIAQDGAEDPKPEDYYTKYNVLEQFFNSADPEQVATVDRAYQFFTAQAKSKGLKNIPSKQDMIKQFLDYQKNNYEVAALTSLEERSNPEFDRGNGGLKNKNTQAFLDKLAKDHPDKYKGYKIDDNTTKLNQAFFKGLSMADHDNKEPFLDLTHEGPSEKTNWKDVSTISEVEGFYGNNTLNQRLSVNSAKKPEVKDESTVKTKEGCPCQNADGSFTGTYSASCCPQPGNLKTDHKSPEYQFWLQDQLKTNAIAQRDRDMFMPWQPDVEIPQSQYVLEDPTREIAANMEAYNIGANAAGAFGGPQALAARTAQGAGQAFGANANTLASVNSRNVSTVNNGLRYNTELEAQGKAEQRNRLAKEYDDTQLTLQNYLNEKNFDREQFANALSNMYTNAANTYDLNSINPYYNIDPSTGGTIEMYNTKGPMSPYKMDNSMPATQEDRMRIYNELSGDGKKPVNAGILKWIMGEDDGATPDPYDQMREQFQFPYEEEGVKARGGQSFPFYTGKIGF